MVSFLCVWVTKLGFSFQAQVKMKVTLGDTLCQDLRAKLNVKSSPSYSRKGKSRKNSTTHGQRTHQQNSRQETLATTRKLENQST